MTQNTKFAIGFYTLCAITLLVALRSASFSPFKAKPLATENWNTNKSSARQILKPAHSIFLSAKRKREIQPITTPIDWKKPKVMEKELVVTLRAGVTNIDELAKQFGAQVTGRLEKLNTYRLSFDDEQAALNAKEQLGSQVESTESNYQIERPDSAEEIAPQSTLDLKVKPGNSDGKIVVGLVDSAVQLQASGLDEGLFLPALSVAGEFSGDVSSPLHGTSMAEAIVQGLGMTGNSEDGTKVRILSVDVYGNSEATTTYQVAEGIVKAIENGATVINLSLGGDGESGLLQRVIEDAHAQGIVFFGAAGNEPVATPTYPAAYSEVVAVTATDALGNLASYANYGDFVDVAAPGTTTVNYNGRSYLVTGTSASTALVSGVAAGLIEKTAATAAKIEESIRTGLSLR